MSLVDIRRNHTRWAINQNPRTITFQRKLKIPKKGYIEEMTETVGPFVVRIYTKGGSPTVQSEVQAERMIDRYYSMLMDYQADVKADTHTTDTFELDGITYKVVAVWLQTIHGEIVGYQCDVERVM